MATDSTKPPQLADAAAKTAAMLERLQWRIHRETPGVENSRNEFPKTATPTDELSEQLERYFAGQRSDRTQDTGASSRIPAEIRSLVVEAAVDKILRSWHNSDSQTLETIQGGVVGRLVEHVLAELLRKAATSAE